MSGGWSTAPDGAPLGAATVTLAEARAAHAQAGGPYHEFLRLPAISAGLYVLPAGEDDPQEPHSEDEIYFVVAGHARFACGSGVSADDRAVGPGDTIYVAKGVEHCFHTIVEELTLLVLFAPARM